uniref:Uncharacterized protein n=1 Tax=Rhizophora mucronata TaxID=61149 RepID=A0A2P2PAS8_RHIMU
MNTIFEST